MSNVTAREELIHRITKQKPTHNQPVKKHLDKMNELVNQDLTKICDENTTAISKSIQTRSVRLIKL